MLKNKVNGKIYIGQTTHSVEKRFQQHTRKSSSCSAIYNAIQYHGWDKFDKDWYECPDEDLNFDEELLVREMGTLSPGGYNLREGGGANGKLSDQTKQKISDAQRGEKNHNFRKTPSEETRQKNREAHLGEKHPMWGVPRREETIQKIIESTLGEKHHNSKRVYQYDLEGTIIGSFGSVGEAGRYLKKSKSKICSCALGHQKTAYGFKWSYIKH